MNEHDLELRQSVWPHVQAIFYAKDGKTVADAAIEIIALVRADERKRIREALLSDEAYDRMTHAAYAHTYKHFTDQEPETLMGEDELIEFRPKREAEMQAALAAIGLTEEPS